MGYVSNSLVMGRDLEYTTTTAETLPKRAICDAIHDALYFNMFAACCMGELPIR